MFNKYGRKTAVNFIHLSDKKSDKLELNYFYKEGLKKKMSLSFCLIIISEKFNDIKLGYIELNIEDKDKRKRYYCLN